MSGKYLKNTKKNKSRRPLVMFIVTILLLTVAAVLLLKGREPQQTQSARVPHSTQPIVQNETVAIQETQMLEVRIVNGLEILDVGSYTGVYMEDGSDELLSDILMLKIRNASDTPVEFATLTMLVGDKTAEFAVSTLAPGATVVLLEKNRMTYNTDTDYSSAELNCENLALFEEPLNLHNDQIKIQILDGAINVTNISGKDINGKVSIYYKNKAAGIYNGGITYRVTLDNGLLAGEIRQLTANHFSDTGSEIMFVTIA